MMGQPQPQKDLFSYHINLDHRVRPDHPLRPIKAAIDFTFVRAEVAHCYGYNGNESVPPEVILKLMFLLFFDNLPSERALMRMLPERLDYLWFLDMGLDDPIPDPSVLSKARKRWGAAVFEQFFVRTVGQCVAAGLVDGTKLHVDSSLNDANASRDSVRHGSPELIAALKAAYAATETKLADTGAVRHSAPVNDRLLSTTDPDAVVVRKGNQPSRPRYHHHRAVDDAHGVITAVETTPGNVAENHRLLPLIEQHQQHTGTAVTTVVGDSKYGTTANFVACAQRDIRAHLGELRAPQHHARSAGIFPDRAFVHDPVTNTVRCPAGQTMQPRFLHPHKRTWEYSLPHGICAACALRSQCTRAVHGRTVHRHEHHALLEQARAQSHSAAASRDRRRRQHLVEGSFADAANCHGFKRARWRRLWRVQIQDWLIAGIQNIKILLRSRRAPVGVVGAAQIISLSGGQGPAGRFAGRKGQLVWSSLRSGFVPVSFSAN